MYKKCGGDLKKFAKYCAEAVARIERERGFKFKRGVPSGWTPPKINWLGRVTPRANDPVIAEVRRARHKISAEHGHDTARIGKHYQELDKKLRKTGKYKFVTK